MANIVWFRRDARLNDNPAWTAGVAEGRVVPLFVIDPRLFDAVTQRRRALLLAGLDVLDSSLRAWGGRLRVEVGDPTKVVPNVAREVDAGAVFVNTDVTPYARARDRQVGDRVALHSFDGNYVHPVGAVVSGSGEAYRVFSAFHRRWLELPVPLVDAPTQVIATQDVGIGLPGKDRPDLDAGETAAYRRVEAFAGRVDRYHEERDNPGLDTTSRISTDLKYGWIGPRAVVSAIVGNGPGREAFVRQLAWRDFYANVMWHFPETAEVAMRSKLRDMAWVNDEGDFEAWKSGQTGYPLVDAGMRQLAVEGWIHNRVRLVVASFLVKDLLIDWRIGEKYFRRHLIDGDVPQNVGNWQWVAGTGTDAAPYFRVFNPVTQSRRFDPNGTYIRRWVPELSDLPDSLLHAPFEAGPLELAGCGVVLGEDYPLPIVEHSWARERAIAAYRSASG